MTRFEEISTRLFCEMAAAAMRLDDLDGVAGSRVKGMLKESCELAMSLMLAQDDYRAKDSFQSSGVADD